MIVLTVVFWVLHIGAVVMWIRGKKNWKKTQEYLDYKTLRETIKEEKKQGT